MPEVLYLWRKVTSWATELQVSLDTVTLNTLQPDADISRGKCFRLPRCKIAQIRPACWSNLVALKKEHKSLFYFKCKIIPLFLEACAIKVMCEFLDILLLPFSRFLVCSKLFLTLFFPGLSLPLCSSVVSPFLLLPFPLLSTIFLFTCLVLHHFCLSLCFLLVSLSSIIVFIFFSDSWWLFLLSSLGLFIAPLLAPSHSSLSILTSTLFYLSVFVSEHIDMYTL